MKGKIDIQGRLYIDKGNGFILQQCYKHPQGFCNNCCPLFGEAEKRVPKKDKESIDSTLNAVPLIRESGNNWNSLKSNAMQVMMRQIVSTQLYRDSIKIVLSICDNNELVFDDFIIEKEQIKE